MSKSGRYVLFVVAAIVGAFAGIAVARGAWGINPLFALLLLFAFFGVIIWLGLRNNKQVPTVDAEARKRALADIADGSARVVVVREGFVGKLSGIDVLLDGAVATQLRSPRFAVLTVVPGRHAVEAQVAMQKKRLGPLDLDLVAGETAIVRIVVELGAARLERETWSPALREKLAQIPMVAA